MSDALVMNGGSTETALKVLSFGVARKDWSPVLHDAAHFLYALERVDASGEGRPRAPTEEGSLLPFDRVQKRLKEAQIEWVKPDDLRGEQQSIL